MSIKRFCTIVIDVNNIALKFVIFLYKMCNLNLQINLNLSAIAPALVRTLKFVKSFTVAAPFWRQFEFSVLSCCSNFAKNESSSFGISDYLPKIQTKSVNYSPEANKNVYIGTGQWDVTWQWKQNASAAHA